METTDIPSPKPFLALFKDFPDAISVNRLRDGKNLAINMGFTALTGYTAAKIGSWISFKDWRHLVAEVQRYGKANRLKVTMRTRSGAVRQAQIFARRVEYEGTPSLLIITSDITEQQKLSEALLESETQLKTIFDNAAVGIAFTDSNLQILRANRILATMAGCQVEDLVGQSVARFTVPEDFAGEEALLRELFEGERDHYRLEKRLIAKDSHVFWADVVVSAVRAADGKPRYLLGMITDIDIRKKAEDSLHESEERYRNVFAAETDAIFLVDPASGKIIDTNQAACRMYGYTLDELLGSPCANVLTEYNLAFQEMQPSSGYAPLHFHKKKDGVTFPVEISASIVRQQGRMVSLVTVRDITERERVEAERERLLQEVQLAHTQLQQLSAQLFQAQENERRNIAYDLHDEIGQAILAIKANLQRIQLANKSAALDEPIAASINIVDTTLEQIRSLALDLRPAMLDDFGLAATLEWYLERQARSGRFKISFQSDLPDRRFPPVVETAGFRVAQAAIMNIVRHSQAQHVHVTLGLASDNRELELVIRDDGIGFDVTAAFDQAKHGQSLGLLGLQERVRLVGGKSTIKSRLGLGTEIRVQFPVHLGDGQ